MKKIQVKDSRSYRAFVLALMQARMEAEKAKGGAK
jgi:hypothetical protein